MNQQAIYLCHVTAINGLYQWKPVSASEDGIYYDPSGFGLESISEIVASVIRTSKKIVIFLDGTNQSFVRRLHQSLLDYPQIEMIFHAEERLGHNAIVLGDAKYRLVDNLEDLEGETDRPITLSDWYRQTPQTVMPQYNQAMNNGLISYFTGVYPSDFFATKHVGLTHQPIADLPSAFCDDMGLNSAFILRDNISLGLSQFENIHLESDDAIELTKTGDRLPFRFVGYADAKPLDSQPNTFLSINRRADLEALKADIEEYETSGVMTKLEHRIVNECTWIRGFCSLPKLLRLDRVSQGQIYPCRYCDQAIGEITSERYDLFTTVSRHSYATKHRRQCDDCYVRDECPQCVLLPEDISDQDYCAFMKDTQASSYFQHYLFTKYLATYSDLLKNASKIYFSHAGHPLLIDQTMVKTFDSAIILFAINGSHYFSSPSSPKIMTASPLQAFILEGLMYGVCKQTLIDCLAAKKTFDQHTFERSYQQLLKLTVQGEKHAS